MNPSQGTNWVPGLVVLAVAVASAIAYLLGSRKLKDEAPQPETLDDHDVRYQLLLGQIREHIANKHQFSET
jgi:hypothetical protein